jgi:hypothetical protein
MTETTTEEESDHISPGDQVEEINGDAAQQQVDQDVVDNDDLEPVHYGSGVSSQPGQGPGRWLSPQSKQYGALMRLF